MYDPFLAVYAEGAAQFRLRTNSLLADTDPSVPAVTERIKNTIPFSGDDLVRAAFACLSADGFEGLRTRSVADRARALIAIASPDYRDQLTAEATKARFF